MFIRLVLLLSLTLYTCIGHGQDSTTKENTLQHSSPYVSQTLSKKNLFYCAFNNEEDHYNLYVKDFSSNELYYDSVTNYIKRSYINVSDRANINRKIILLCEDKALYNSQDNRFCDSALKPVMKNLGINVINIEKNRCFADKNFDLISFELTRNNRSEKVYYQYSLCGDQESNLFENNSIKVIPLKKDWTLFIEKNSLIL